MPISTHAASFTGLRQDVLDEGERLVDDILGDAHVALVGITNEGVLRPGGLQRIDHHQRAFNRSCAGRKLEVLFEKPGRIAGQLVGRSAYLQPVQVMAPTSLIGQIATVRIIDVGSNSLFGELDRAEARDQALAGTGG